MLVEKDSDMRAKMKKADRTSIIISSSFPMTKSPFVCSLTIRTTTTIREMLLISVKRKSARRQRQADMNWNSTVFTAIACQCQFYSSPSSSLHFICKDERNGPMPFFSFCSATSRYCFLFVWMCDNLICSLASFFVFFIKRMNFMRRNVCWIFRTKLTDADADPIRWIKTKERNDRWSVVLLIENSLTFDRGHRERTYVCLERLSERVVSVDWMKIEHQLERFH